MPLASIQEPANVQELTSVQEPGGVQDRPAITQESESFFLRRKLQRDLHDGLGPTMTAANMRIETARRLLDNDPDRAAELLAQAHAEIGLSICQMRQLIYHLHLSSEVPAQGLDQAIKALGAQFQQATGGKLKVIVNCSPIGSEATTEVLEELYFIAREALTNVVRHAHATQCLVNLSASASGITLTVKDDGIGLTEPQTSGIGLKSMQERAAEQGGICTIYAHVSGGIQLEAFIPFKPTGLKGRTERNSCNYDPLC